MRLSHILMQTESLTESLHGNMENQPPNAETVPESSRTWDAAQHSTAQPSTA